MLPARFEPAIPESKRQNSLCITRMHFVLSKSVQWLRRLVVGLLSVNVISGDFGSLLSASRHKCCILIGAFRLFLSEGQSGEDWKPYNKAKHMFVFIVVPCCCTLFQSLLYCSNSCTSLHFKTLKSHTKTLKIRPQHVSVSFETIFSGSMTVLR
jgi:hypothetical protein